MVFKLSLRLRLSLFLFCLISKSGVFFAIYEQKMRRMVFILCSWKLPFLGGGRGKTDSEPEDFLFDPGGEVGAEEERGNDDEEPRPCLCRGDIACPLLKQGIPQGVEDVTAEEDV